MTEVLDADIHGYPTLAAMPITAILLTFKKQTAAIDVSAAVSVQDVISTILSVFHLQASTRIILRRTRDGAIAVPGPKLSPGEYTVEAIESKSWQWTVEAVCGLPTRRITANLFSHLSRMVTSS